MRTFPWDDCPPADPIPRQDIQVFRIKRGEAVFIRFLGPWKGAWMHFGPTHSEPCVKEVTRCPLCPDTGRFWEGYTPAALHQPSFDLGTGKRLDLWQPIIFPVSDRMAADLRTLSLGVTGLIAEVKRNKGVVGKTNWRFIERTASAYKQPMPECFDVMPILFRMWRMFSKAPEIRAYLLSDDTSAVERRATSEPG